MSPRNKGGGKTPDNVVKLLKDEVARTSQAATARATGLTLKGIQNYLKGIGEPTTATLQKLADYFDVSVEELRGEIVELTLKNGTKIPIRWNTLKLNAVEIALLFDKGTTQDEFNGVLTSVIARYLRSLPGEPLTLSKESITDRFENFKAIDLGF